jgi:hypothetical protein
MAPAHRRQLKDFDSLPDDSVVGDPLAAELLSISLWTLNRTNPVPPIQISERRRGRRTGDLRNLIRGNRQPNSTIK